MMKIHINKIRTLISLLLVFTLLITETAVTAQVKTTSSNKIKAVQLGTTISTECLYERVFAIKVSNCGKYLSSSSSGVIVNETNSNKSEVQISVYRYGDEDENDTMDNIPVALYMNEDEKYLTLGVTARKKTMICLNANLKKDASQRFLLKKANDWSKTNLSYYMYHPETGMYIGVTEDQHLYAFGKEAPNYSFVLEKKGYTSVGLLTTLPGYELLTDAQKYRVLDICGGIGARSFWRYGGYDTEWTVEHALSDSVEAIYKAKDTTTAEEQKTEILNILKIEAYKNQTSYYAIPELPGADDVVCTSGNKTYGKYDFWSGTMLNGNKFTYTINDNYGVQTIQVYVQDNWTAEQNGKNFLEAIKQIPYPVRRNIKNVKIRNDSANYFNCGSNDLYIRINWVSSIDGISQTILHEFGHSLDYVYNVNGSGSWKKAMNTDIICVSEYGNTNENEDFAEFSRLYFQMYGNMNGMFALRQVFPARFAAYTKILVKAGYEDIYENYLNYEYDNLRQEEIARFTFDDITSGLRTDTAIAIAKGTVDLEEDSVSGKALRLDGTGSNYIEVMNRNKTSLLRGYESFTISYYSKPVKTKTSWSVFLASDDKEQKVGSERYIGIQDNKTSMNVERYNNFEVRSAAISVDNMNLDGWRHVVLVVDKKKTTLYVDGVESSSSKSEVTVSDILGRYGIFYIGKGNWGSGEFFSGLIDEFVVYGRALSVEEVQKLCEKDTKKTEQKYTVKYKASTGGYITGTAEQQITAKEQTTEVTAVANQGYVFCQWNDGMTSVSRMDQGISKDTVFTAEFKKIQEEPEQEEPEQEEPEQEEPEQEEPEQEEPKTEDQILEDKQEKEDSQRDEEIVLDEIAITINASVVKLAPGEKTTLKVDFIPNNSTQDKTVSWTTNNEKIVKINNEGVVTAIAPGTAVVQATVGNKSASITITVEEPIYVNKIIKVGKLKYKITKYKKGKNTVTVIGYAGDVKDVSLKIPNTIKYKSNNFKVTKIGKNAFKNQTTIQSVVIGKNIKVIGKYAFYGCSGLKIIKLKGKIVKEIGKGAFKDIKRYANFEVPWELQRKYIIVLRAAKTKYFTVK